MSDSTSISLVRAAKEENVEGVRTCLTHDDCDVNATDDEGHSALMWAVKKVKHETDCYGCILKTLLNDPRVCIDMKYTTFKRSILHVACGSGPRGVHQAYKDSRAPRASAVGAQLLLEDGRCDVNAQDSEGRTPVMFAVTKCNTPDDERYVEICRLILRHPSYQVNVADDQNETVLLKAVEKYAGTFFPSERKCKIAEMLISNPACDVNWRGGSYCDTALIRLLASVQSVDDTCGRLIRLLLDRSDLDIQVANLNCNTAIDVLLGRKDFRCRDFNCESSIAEFLIRSLRKKGFALSSYWKTAIVLAPSVVCREFLNYEFNATVDQASRERGEDEFANYFVTRDKSDGETALHCAVALNSLAKVSLLLQYGPDHSAKWRGMTPLELAIAYSANPKILTSLSRGMCKGEIAQAIKNCSLVGETVQDCCLRLNVPNWVQKFSSDSDKSANLVRRKTLSYPEHKLRVHSNPESSRDVINPLEIVRTCRQTFTKYSDEIQLLKDDVTELLEAVSDVLAERFEGLRFTPVLSGSMAEGTKVHTPNELDYICLLDQQSFECFYHGHYGIALTKHDQTIPDAFDKHDTVNHVRFLALLFYHGVEYALKTLLDPQQQTGSRRITLFKSPLIFGDKISRMQMVWNGPQIQNLSISVDLVVGVAITRYEYPRWFDIDSDEYLAILKSNRHLQIPPNVDDDPVVSGSHVEATYINSLPINAKRGYVLAKAVRVTSIAKPDEDLSSTFCLAEDVAIDDDLITSHILKSCLIKLTLDGNTRRRRSELNDQTLPTEWSIKIYSQLEEQLENKKIIESWMNTVLLNCSGCIVEHSCCKKRKLMLAMTCKTLQWLQNNKAQLQDIDYSNNCDHCDVKTRVYARSGAHCPC